MSYYEYMVLPAPRTAPRAKGVKGLDGRFAVGLAALMNEHAADGWQFQRAETMPCEERRSLIARKTVEMQTVLVFRRSVEPVARTVSASHRTSTEMPENPAGRIDARPAARVTSDPEPIAAPRPATAEPSRSMPKLGPARGEADHVQPFPGAGRN